MNLKNLVRLTHSDCFACRWAQYDIVIWPQSFDTMSNSVLYGYVKVQEHIQGGPRSKHMEVILCPEHMVQALISFEQTAQEEVNLAKAFDAWTERIER